MTPEEAYEEALRRIREAEETGALELVFGGQFFDGLELNPLRFGLEDFRNVGFKSFFSVLTGHRTSLWSNCGHRFCL